MDDYQVNEIAVVQAYELIEERHFVVGTDWERSHLTPAQEQAFIQKHSWDAFGRWHLALDSRSPEETIERYQFAYGDGVRVHRSALVSCAARAQQGGHQQLERTALELLHRLDDKAGVEHHCPVADG